MWEVSSSVGFIGVLLVTLVDCDYIIAKTITMTTNKTIRKDNITNIDSHILYSNIRNLF